MSNEVAKKVVRGYKVFNPDWTCIHRGNRGNKKQYTCPGKFEEEGEIAICGHGMHFCQSAIDCFSYYGFNPNNKVAEVIAYGEVLTSGNKSCTNKLEIVRELSWEEVLQLVNIGNDCTGFGNTGDRNTGNCNTGDRNSGYGNSGDNNAGDWNTGNGNTGNNNTGDQNTGYRNTGTGNTGDKNTGNNNTGNWNTGYYNAGGMNTGHCNIGNWNTGHCNIGNWNTGDYNTGERNTGDWNKSANNTGCFNVREHKVMLFDKPSNWTYADWYFSEAKRLLERAAQPMITRWVSAEDMTAEEKAANPSYKTTGGYLKVIKNSVDARQAWWNNLSEEDKTVIKEIPNFDAKIFFECTGIRVE